jgi:hypothetical protein
MKTTIQQLFKQLEICLTSEQVSDPNNPDGYYDSVQHKSIVMDAFHKLKQCYEAGANK